MIRAVIERCAGIDVGKRELAVTVLTGAADAEPEAETRAYTAMTGQLEALRQWLTEQEVTDVVMESTGSYWKPVMNILEQSVRVWIAQPQAVKNLRGHKTDMKDSHWLAHLLRHGMIRPSFIPPRSIRELRDLTRRRKKVLGAAASEKNRVMKVLEDANVKLSSVLSDVFGVSGQLMLEALLEEEVELTEIPELARGRLRQKQPQILEALQGHRMNDHHRFLIRQSLDHLQFLEQQLEQLEEQIQHRLQQWKQEYELIQSLPGVKQHTGAAILAEIGTDMTVFGSDKQLASWGGVAPGNNRSAGKQRNSRTTRGNRWLQAALVESSWAAIAARGGFYRQRYFRICARTGRKKAIIATARSLLVAAYWILTTKQPYHSPNTAQQQAEQRDSMVRHHCRRLRQLGVQIVELDQEHNDPDPPPPTKRRARPKGRLGLRTR
jgi:transposase